MTILDTTRELKRFTKQTFEVKDGNNLVTRHTLLVNPEDMSVNEPAKATVTETIGGGYITDFGSGFRQVNISGITGYRARYNADGILRDGYSEFVHFRDEVYRKFIESNNPNYAMYWYNWEDEEYYRVQPMNFRLMRNRSEPILYRYELQMTCLEQLGKGAKKPIMDSDDIAELNLAEAGENLAESISSIGEVASRFNVR